MVLIWLEDLEWWAHCLKETACTWNNSALPSEQHSLGYKFLLVAKSQLPVYFDYLSVSNSLSSLPCLLGQVFRQILSINQICDEKNKLYFEPTNNGIYRIKEILIKIAYFFTWQNMLKIISSLFPYRSRANFLTYMGSTGVSVLDFSGDLILTRPLR